MMVERAVAVGRGRAREVQRAERRAVADRRADDLHHVRVGVLFLADDLCGDGADVGGPLPERHDTAPQERRVERGQVALQINHDCELARRIEARYRLEHAV
jgi:hypothetical protein